MSGLFKTVALNKDVLKKPRASTKSGKPPKVKEDWTKKKRKESYAPFIFELLQKVHPETVLSLFAMNTVNSFVHKLFERIAAEASKVGSQAGIKYQQKNDNSGSLDFLLTEDNWKTSTFFGIFKASSILDFAKSRPCLIMHEDSVENFFCPNTN